MVAESADKRDASLRRRQDLGYSAYKLQTCHSKHLRSQLLVQRPKRALEVGCGEGFFTQIVSDYAAHVTAIDLTEKIAPSVRSRPNVTFLEADGTRLPFDDESFDFIYSTDVIEHVDEDARFIAESLRVLEPGGRLVIMTPNRDRLANSIPALIGRRPSYPLFLGTDPVLGDIIHVREYGKRQLLGLLHPYHHVLRTYYVKGFFLGIGSRGWSQPPRILEPICKYWMLVACKVSREATPQDGETDPDG